MSDSGTAKWETSLKGHYRARGASVVQSEPFNWSKSLALQQNVDEVVGMWLCLRMWLFYLNFLTSFNPAKCLGFFIRLSSLQGSCVGTEC